MLARGLRATAGLGGLGAALLLGRTWRDKSNSRTWKENEVRARSLLSRSRTSALLLPALSAEEEPSKQYASNGYPADMLCDLDVLEEEEEDEEGEGELGLVGSPNDQGRQQAQVEKLKAAVGKARDLCWVKMYESGAPGMTVAISVNGKQVWQHGFGYSDLENRLLAGTGCIMRVASISKPLTMAVLARLWEEGKVDLDANVRKYVPDWPVKTVDGKEVELTVRQLCCHLSGVRHYDRKEDEGKVKDEFQKEEYYIKEHFSTTDESVALFKDDALLSAPGQEFHYTTHGFTLLARVIEEVTGQPFHKYMQAQFKELGLSNTFLDLNDPLIQNRARYYVRDKHHKLKNAPYVDNSYKWAGGGFLSSVGDLIRFGSMMLYSFQQTKVTSKPKPETTSKPTISTPPPNPPTTSEAPSESEPSVPPSVPQTPQPSNPEEGEGSNGSQIKEITGKPLEKVDYHPGPFAAVNNVKPPVRYLPGFLKASTVAELWKPQPGASVGWGGDNLGYGLGWAVRSKKKVAGFARDDFFYVSHTGGAIGASSVLLIAPKPVKQDSMLPQGVVVAILCNMQGVGLNQLAVDIAKCFDGLDVEKPVKVQKIYQC